MQNIWYATPKRLATHRLGGCRIPDESREVGCTVKIFKPVSFQDRSSRPCWLIKWGMKTLVQDALPSECVVGVSNRDTAARFRPLWTPLHNDTCAYLPDARNWILKMSSWINCYQLFFNTIFLGQSTKVVGFVTEIWFWVHVSPNTWKQVKISRVESNWILLGLRLNLFSLPLFLHKEYRLLPNNAITLIVM